MKTNTQQASLERYVLDWIFPALFALLISATIRFHSLAPMPTMARMVGNLLAIAAVGFVALLARGVRLRLGNDVVLLWIAFTASATISILGSGGADWSLLRLELYASVGLLGLNFYLLYREANHLPLEHYFVAISVVHIPFLAAAILWIGDLTPPFWQSGTRVAHFAHVRQFGEFGFLAAVSATAASVLSKRLYVPSLCLAAAAVFGLMLTGCRGALLAWVLFVLLTTITCRQPGRCMIHGLLVVATAGGFVWYLDHSGLLQSPNIFYRVSSATTQNFDSGRRTLWLDSVKQIAAHPLFGSGPEGYWLSGCCDRQILQAHNFVLQFLMEFGLVGCGILVALLIRVLSNAGGLGRFVNTALATQANRVLACLLASFLAYGLIDQMMYHLLPLLHLGLFVGLFAAGLAQARSTPAPESGNSVPATSRY